jgi:hypothetical protein
VDDDNPVHMDFGEAVEDNATVVHDSRKQSELGVFLALQRH